MVQLQQGRRVDQRHSDVKTLQSSSEDRTHRLTIYNKSEIEHFNDPRNRDLPDVTVPTSAIVMVVRPLCSKISQPKLWLSDRSEASNGHCRCGSLLPVQSTITSFDVCVATESIRWVNGGPGHSDLLLRHVRSRRSSKLTIVLV